MRARSRRRAPEGFEVDVWKTPAGTNQRRLDRLKAKINPASI